MNRLQSLSATMLLVLLTIVSSAQANPWHALYGKQLVFDVYRNGKPVGLYQTQFRGEGDNWQVEARMELDVKWLLWSFSYRYHAIETWKQGGLEGLDVQIDSNGDNQHFSFERQGDWLQEQGGEKVALPVLATHHYDASVVNSDRVVNTLTGKINHISVKPMGIETLLIGDTAISANRYQYHGDLTQTEVWYDLNGRWVGLEFVDPQGVNMSFKCRSCGQGASL